MSLLNVSVLPDRVLMTVDTAGEQVKDGRRVKREISKMLPLVHLGAMVGVCGNTAMAIAVVQQAMIGPAKTFDELVPLIKPITEAAFRSVSREAKANKTPITDQQVVAFAGWSEADGAPAAYLCVRNAQHAFTVSRVLTTIFCPGAEQLPERDPAELDDLVMAARAQVEETHAKHPQIPIGGQLLVAEVTRNSINVRNHGAL
ncbi:MAG: hypothetical protein MK141_01850 [Pseudoxanthomonas sp.]|uniref:hypothetical protein n=1 Tax=Pseudoxanthomonas sp. TaxID=1871049 RepID=UPI002587FD55|nr:hypothetical protein [Pseudoxanthomonas sp.]MCH2090309.1 hypothetical protein [Pseudoxanthomonas sp.]